MSAESVKAEPKGDRAMLGGAGLGMSRDRVAGLAWGTANSLLVVAIVLMANYLAFRHYARWDWTREGIYSLSERSLVELRAVDAPVHLYVFMAQGEQNYDQVRELLERYKAESTFLDVEYVDPDRHPAEYRILAQRFDVGTGVTSEGAAFSDVAVVVTAGERTWKITKDEFLSVDVGSFDSEGGPKIDVRAEQALTGAIVQVRTGEPTRVCVSAGHGEWSIEAGGERTLHRLRDELRRENVELEAVETRGTETIPERCHALYVLGPVRAFSEQEAEKLRAYVAGGGNVLLALDPVIEDDRIEQTGLEALASDWGIEIDASVVLELDPSHLLPPPNPAGPFLAGYGQHEIVGSIVGRAVPVGMMLARSVRAHGEAPGSFLMASQRSYAETRPAELLAGVEPAAGPDDVAGPVSLAVAVDTLATPDGSGVAPAASTRGRGGRVIVLGDSDFLQAELLQPVFANRDLVAAMTGWLTEREALIALAPKQVDAVPMQITVEDLGSLALRVLVLMPLAMVVMGFAVWWSRRS